MRTVTFSDPRVIERLRRDFACAWSNIRPKESFKDGGTVTRSGQILRLDLKNGTGSRNICAVIATPWGRIVHAVPGHCDPDTFLRELDFGLEAARRALAPDGADRLAALYSDRLEYPVEGQGDLLVREAMEHLASSPPLPLESILKSEIAGIAPRRTR